MRSLRSRLLFILILTILFNTTFMVSVTLFGSSRARDKWHAMVSRESLSRLALVVAGLYENYGQITVANSLQAFSPLTHFTDELSSFAIFDADRTPVYHWRNHSFITLAAENNLEPQLAVKNEGQIVGWVACVPSDFYFIEPNKKLVQYMIQILILGRILSITAVLILSRRLSRGISADARMLAGLLGRLSRGERNIHFPEQRSVEFQAIARSATRLQASLSKEERLRRQWTQDIAHDLKTPVTALQSQLEGIKDGIFTLSPQRFDTLESEFAQIDKLVQDLSLLSQVESPEMVPLIRKIKSGEFLAQICSRFRAVTDATGIHLECLCNNDISFLADPDLLTRAVNNLIQNAIQHAAKSGTIRVELSGEGEGVAIAVENPGRIPEADLPKLFERLYRGDAGRSSRGSGLGLTIVRAVAEKLGGSVTARNTSRGTVLIRLILPGEA